MREHPHFLLYGLELEHFEIGKRSCFWWMEAKSARPGWRIDEYSKKRIKTLGICKTDKGSERGFGRESREEDVCVCERPVEAFRLLYLLVQHVSKDQNTPVLLLPL